MGARFEELAWLIADTPMGVCLDTCHAFAAGYDVRGAPSQVLNALDRAVGLERCPWSTSTTPWGGWEAA